MGNIELRKMKIANKLMDVVNLQDYGQKNEMYSRQYTALTSPDSDYVYPVLTQTEYMAGKVGMYPSGNMVGFYNNPSQECAQEYSKENIIDFSNVDNMKELIETQEMVRNLENEILSNPENVTELKINPTDTPLMQGLKEAINSKHCDINSYSNRFGGNFANTVRILKESSITIAKAVQIAEATDVAVDITFRDKGEEIANPIGNPIMVTLTGGDDCDD